MLYIWLHVIYRLQHINPNRFAQTHAGMRASKMHLIYLRCCSFVAVLISTECRENKTIANIIVAPNI